MTDTPQQVHEPGERAPGSASAATPPSGAKAPGGTPLLADQPLEGERRGGGGAGRRRRRAGRRRSRSAMTTSRSPSAPRPTSRTSASARHARRGRRRIGERRRSPRSCCRRWTTSTARWRPPTRATPCSTASGSSGRARGRARARRDRVLLADRRGLRPVLPRGRGDRPPGAGRKRERRRGRGLPARVPARGHRHQARTRGRGGLAGGVDGNPARLLQDTRRRQEGERRGDQEGLPQARAPVPP